MLYKVVPVRWTPLMLKRSVENIDQKGYRKKEGPNPFADIFYRKYPHLQEALRNRNAVYNKTMELVESLEASGEAIVIRSEKPIEVGRMEKDTAKLTALYEEGYHQAARKLSI